MIQLKDVLHQLRHPARDRSGNPVPVQVEFVTCNLSEGTGGELLSLEGVVLAKHARRALGKGSRPAGAPRSGEAPPAELPELLNFFLVVSRQVRAVHVRLITQFNYETVIY